MYNHPVFLSSRPFPSSYGNTSCAGETVRLHSGRPSPAWSLFILRRDPAVLLAGSSKTESVCRQSFTFRASTTTELVCRWQRHVVLGVWQTGRLDSVSSTSKIEPHLTPAPGSARMLGWVCWALDRVSGLAGWQAGGELPRLLGSKRNMTNSQPLLGSTQSLGVSYFLDPPNH